ncbi:MAG: hypothetical protein AB7I38_06505 [Dehalococcoidia bacterium]
MGAGLTLEAGQNDVASQTRAARLAAWGRDLSSLIGFTTVSALVAVGWMLARTDRGRYDLGTGDAVLALSVFAAAGPAWSAWRWLALRDGARGRGGAGTRLWLVVALHPTALPSWLWLTAALMVSGVGLLELAAMAPLAMFLTGAVLMAGSAVLLLARPSAAPLHEWFARASFGGRR